MLVEDLVNQYATELLSSDNLEIINIDLMN